MSERHVRLDIEFSVGPENRLIMDIREDAVVIFYPSKGELSLRGPGVNTEYQNVKCIVAYAEEKGR